MLLLFDAVVLVTKGPLGWTLPLAQCQLLLEVLKCVVNLSRQVLCHHTSCMPFTAWHVGIFTYFARKLAYHTNVDLLQSSSVMLSCCFTVYPRPATVGTAKYCKTDTAG